MKTYFFIGSADLYIARISENPDGVVFSSRYSIAPVVVENLNTLSKALSRRTLKSHLQNDYLRFAINIKKC